MEHKFCRVKLWKVLSIWRVLLISHARWKDNLQYYYLKYEDMIRFEMLMQSYWHLLTNITIVSGLYWCLLTLINNSHSMMVGNIEEFLLMSKALLIYRSSFVIFVNCKLSTSNKINLEVSIGMFVLFPLFGAAVASSAKKTQRYFTFYIFSNIK